MRNTSIWIVVFAVALAGCLDADPLPNLPDASGGKGGNGKGGSGGGTMTDAEVDDDAPVSDADPNPCRACVRAACPTDYATCDGMPKCIATVECTYADDCFSKPLFDFNNCGINCAGKSGIGSQTDPEVPPLTALGVCGWAACSVSACGGMP